MCFYYIPTDKPYNYYNLDKPRDVVDKDLHKFDEFYRRTNIKKGQLYHVK